MKTHRPFWKGRIAVLVLATAACMGVAASPGRAQSSTGPFQFRDVGRETGFLPAAADIQGHGAGWGDVDGDGWADLYVGTFHYAGTKPNMLFRNREGKFALDEQPQLRISTRATGVVFADLDADGDLDLYVASMPAKADSRLAARVGHAFAGCSLFRNDGEGRFTDISKECGACPEAFGGRSATVLDFDGDGRLDLLVGEEPKSGYNGSETNTTRLFHNAGDLRFEDFSREVGIPPGAAGLGVAAADVNGDTWPDIFLASTIGNYLLLNDGDGKFYEPPDARETFAWPTAKGDNAVCGVAISDVNGDALPDIVIGQHYDSPWIEPVANRLYLNRGVKDTVLRFEEATEQAGLTPLPLKGPHVEIQDFDNDGLVDIYTSIVKFADGRPHPVIFRNTGEGGDVPRFECPALGVNDFPTPEDRATKGSGKFYEKMIADGKIVYSAPGPTCDFNRDGRLDMVLPNWWVEMPSLLLQNETEGGHWLDVRVAGGDGVNAMGIGSRVEIYEAGRAGEEKARLGAREIATGFGYASSQEAVAHFGLGGRTECDVVVTLPHGKGRLVREGVKADQRIIVKP
ncbi:MAG: CRTAC1 family protein [Pirellulaceae bacterium]